MLNHAQRQQGYTGPAQLVPLFPMLSPRCLSHLLVFLFLLFLLFLAHFEYYCS